MNNRLIGFILTPALLFYCGVSFAQDGELKSDEERMFYFLGTNYGGTLQQLGLSDDELEFVIQGMRAAIKGTAIELDEELMMQKLQEMGAERMQAAANEEKALAQAYLDKMAAKDGAITTDSGLVFRELVAGTGKSPTGTSLVRAHYHGTLRDGTVFDSSVERGEPFEASLGSVIPCWKEAMALMKEGGKSEVTCPADLAYGDRGVGAIPAGSALTFEVELLAVISE